MCLETLVDNATPGPVTVTFEGGGDGGPQLVDQPGHIGGQRRGTPRRQAQDPRAMRFIEIVDVAPVVGNRLVGCPQFEETADQAELAGTVGAHGEQIESMVLHTDSETNGGNRPVLADHIFDGVDLGGRREGKIIRIARRIQEPGRQRP